jgi:threonyl-tRNA synthetase
LAPTQVALLTVTDRQLEYAHELQKEFKAKGIRVFLDERGEKLGYKIREAQMQKIPYMLILGDKELQNKTLSVRLSNGKVIESLSREEFLNQILNEKKERLLESGFEAATNKNQEVSHSSI